jgi:hypothetical protein
MRAENPITFSDERDRESTQMSGEIAARSRLEFGAVTVVNEPTGIVRSGSEIAPSTSRKRSRNRFEIRAAAGAQHQGVSDPRVMPRSKVVGEGGGRSRPHCCSGAEFRAAKCAALFTNALGLTVVKRLSERE